MTEVVISTCYGGFGLSEEAILLGRNLSGNPLWGGPCLKGEGEEGNFDCCKGINLERTDPTLIEVIKQLGKKASDKFSNLIIVNVPKGTLYRIVEYDGFESTPSILKYKYKEE